MRVQRDGHVWAVYDGAELDAVAVFRTERASDVLLV